MTKRELKEMLHYYSRLREKIMSGERRAKIIDRGRNKTVIIPEWAYLMEVFITEIVEKEKDKIFGRMIEYSVRQGKTDKTFYPQENGTIILHPENEHYKDIIVHRKSGKTYRKSYTRRTAGKQVGFGKQNNRGRWDEVNNKCKQAG